LYAHHAETIQRVVEHFQSDGEVEALLLGGSVAHGFERPESDIDLLIIVSDERHAQRSLLGQLAFYSSELCTYPEGYVDGKYLSPGLLQLLAEKGSEPARFAFQDAGVLFSRLDGLDATLTRITRYPLEAKAERMVRFAAQLEAWNWYASEALKLDNPYLLGVSVDKLVLFGGRLILAHNELLHPYHKWFPRVLENAPDKPADLMTAIGDLLAGPSGENIGRFYEMVKGFREWGSLDVSWPVQFMADSELNWVNGPTPIDDL
jgi:predicted nucleotidyltransferase